MMMTKLARAKENLLGNPSSNAQVMKNTTLLFHV